MLIDSHCHLEFPAFGDNLDAVIARAREAGVARMVTISTTMKGLPEISAIADKYEDVYCTVGVHPHHAAEEGERVSADDIINVASGKKVVGIGETGLDYFYDHSPRDVQRANFREHIRACLATGLPLIVHSRDAEEDTIKILKEERAGAGEGACASCASRRSSSFAPLSGVMHCFSSKRVLAESALEMGFYISVSGMITFKKSVELRNIIKDVPMDRLLVETDSPYLAPEPHRGKDCEPAFVAQTAKILAEIKGVSVQEISQRTTENFFRLFDKVPKA
jgi:TatD DNase family protein